MPKSAFILGGTGQIGRALAESLIEAGWTVTASHRGRSPAPTHLVDLGVNLVAFDRDAAALGDVLGAGADVLIDTAAYDASHARQLIEVQRDIGSFIVISSASVYRDDRGRTLDEAAQHGFPHFPDPIPESNPSVEAGPSTYSTRKIALEREMLDVARPPATILRPCAIYGVGSRHPREWWLVKRMLDQRPAIPLAFSGRSRFHTASVLNIAALARVVVENPRRSILNIADPIAPSVSDIAAIIGRQLGYAGRFVEIGDARMPVGRTPWSVPRPIVVSCSAASALGYSPAATYAQGVAPVCDWLAATASEANWRERFPALAAYPSELFNYAAEDEYLAGLVDG